MHHDNIHRATFQHLARRALASRHIGHAAGQRVDAGERAYFAVIDNDQVEVGKARQDQFCQPFGFDAGQFHVRPEARGPRRFEHRDPAIRLAAPGPVHLPVNPGQAKMQIACIGCTEIKVIRR